MRSATYKYFGLEYDPFSKDIDDQALWSPPSKKRLVETFVEAVCDRRHVLLTGEPGAGKTAVLRAVRHALPQTRFRVTYCHNSTLGRRDFYRQLCLAIGLHPKATAAAVFNAITDYVEQLAQERAYHPIFLLDEAHLLRDEMLDHLHILQNYAWDQKPLLTLVLIGLPELRERMLRRRHRSLMGRIHHRLVLEPLQPNDTADYLRFRLQRAGCDETLFPMDSVALLHEKTGGVMRDIDRIASLALDVATRRKSRIVHKDLLLETIGLDANGET